MDIIANYADIFIMLSIGFGLFMAWGIGANDVSNAMGTSVGSAAITFKQAVVIAVIFEFSGAILAGGEVTDTVRKGILDAVLFTNNPHLLVYGMLASLLAAGAWLLIASSLGWPVSTTHSIVGAIVGFGAVGVGIDAVAWDKVIKIVMSWVVSPVLAGTLAVFIFKSLQFLVIDTKDPLMNAKRYLPFYVFFVGFIIALVTQFKGLKHIDSLEYISKDVSLSLIIAIIVGILAAVIAAFIMRNIKINPKDDKDFHYANMEKLFAVLMVITASAMAFAHGSNDVANAIGPLAAVYSIVEAGGDITSRSAIPSWVLLVGGGGIIFGFVTYGFKVMKTIGKGITELTPSRGFAAELAAATTVVLASSTGIPVSTTQVLVGAVLGVGIARGVVALNMRVINTIFLSWLITLPAGAVMSILFFFVLKGVFGA
ncbi:inorganic phosphate transporter [Candidatus Vesicomyidisocius sp. SY067_SCS001]|uniref:inorganic phosphate transporter n=1 Tax=Candidatus Vesicomyidisocius sp. SY067_SCS001 TaxID=2732590 RepID=UPI0016820065|nr:inorganic phosphate transporter [Candidatus Vesicomyosocius sp. SY067_SCS001]